MKAESKLIKARGHGFGRLKSEFCRLRNNDGQAFH